jgi:hypothetical protein
MHHYLVVCYAPLTVNQNRHGHIQVHVIYVKVGGLSGRSGNY